MGAGAAGANQRLQQENQLLAQQLQERRAELARLAQYYNQCLMMQTVSAQYGDLWVRALTAESATYSNNQNEWLNCETVWDRSCRTA